MSVTRIIGIDCAVDPRKTGLVSARIQGDDLLIEQARLASKQHLAADIVVEWISGADEVLLCLDAPLGWPLALGASMKEHRAGEALSQSANSLFRRQTDDFIHQHLGKRPLDVGADRIARTAKAALDLLNSISSSMNASVTMAWSPSSRAKVSAIEVYPAATRIAWRCADGSEAESDLRGHYRTKADFGMPESEHIHDALACVVAGKDFLLGRCYPPQDLETAEKEGWIWVASR